MSLVDQLRRHAASDPTRSALIGTGWSLSYQDLVCAVEEFAKQLRCSGARVLGNALPNSAAWIIVDLAAMEAGLCSIPIPSFFSKQQTEHCIDAAGVDVLLTHKGDPRSDRFTSLSSHEPAQYQMIDQTYLWYPLRLNDPVAQVPEGVRKITFTSGTTGRPKGVMLGETEMESLIKSLISGTGFSAQDIHLVQMPLAVLLENLAGVYTALWAGGRVVIPKSQELGLSGSSQINGERLLQSLGTFKATTAILTPQILLKLTEAIEAGACVPDSLRFLAVGGAPVSVSLLERASRVGLPVYQGYGLSENCSVTTLNLPHFNKVGSLGRPLPHTRLRVDNEGEIVIEDSSFRGYLGEPQRRPGPYRTGDLGYLDADGFLYLTGRKKNLFITSFGRNVSPDWIEAELTLQPAIAQAAVFGESRPFNLALIVIEPGYSHAQTDHAVEFVNSTLPDYARIGRWLAAPKPFTPSDNTLTGTGRIRRAELWTKYQTLFEAIYNEERQL